MNAPMSAAGLETVASPPLARAGLEAAEPTPADLADALLLEAELLAAIDEPEALPDSLNLYLREIGQAPLLTAADEAELMRAINAGKAAAAALAAGGRIAPLVRRQLNAAREAGEAARARMLTANLRLVVSIAKKYRGVGLPFLDLIQEGNIGLMRGLDKFDASRGLKFSTYATWWIRQAVTRSLAESARIIRLPVHRSDDTRAYSKARNALLGELGREPNDAELIARLNRELAPGAAERDQAAGLQEADEAPEEAPEELAGEELSPLAADEGGAGLQEAGVQPQVKQKKVWTPKRLAAVREAQRIANIERLDRPVGEDLNDAESCLGAFVPSPANTAEEAEAAMLTEGLREAVATLPERERRIIELRYGLNDGQYRTLEEVGATFGVTRERIRQLESQALRKLRHPSRARKIMSRTDAA